MRAYDSANLVVGTGSLGTYTVNEIGAVAGQGVAHTGTELNSPHCAVPLGSGTGQGVCAVRQTPVFDWATRRRSVVLPVSTWPGTRA